MTVSEANHPLIFCRFIFVSFHIFALKKIDEVRNKEMIHFKLDTRKEKISW